MGYFGERDGEEPERGYESRHAAHRPGALPERRAWGALPERRAWGAPRAA